jgi:hypothetical protein
MKRLLWVLAGALVLALVMIPLSAQQPPAGQRAAGAAAGAAAQQPPAGQRTGAAQPPRAAAGGRGVVAVPQTNDEPPARVPVGFTPIFNGKDLTGWHVSKTNHHGTTPDYHVWHGMILGSQQPIGQGGVLLTDKKYRNFEIYMEVKPDWGCDSGLFFLVDEAGHGYQLMLDYLPGGSMAAGMYGERIEGVNMNGPGWENLTPEQRQEIQARRTENWQKAWKREAWNTVRMRVEGNPPRVTAWLNDELTFQGTDTANHANNGATEGPIAIQVHGGERWRAGGFWRWRVIAVKELPDTAPRK